MSDAARRPVPLNVSPRQRAVWIVLLAALAILGNHFHLPLFFGVDFIFGSIAVLLALTLFGLSPALLVAAVGGAYTVHLWGHPYALLVLVLEPLAVHLLQRRLDQLALADAVFWLLLGMPLVVLLYSTQLGFDLHQAGFIAIKQALNGIFNAVVACLMTFGLLSLRNNLRSAAPPSRIPIASLLFNALLVLTMLAGMLPQIIESHEQRRQLEGDIHDRLGRVGGRVVTALLDTPAARLPTALIPDDVAVALLDAQGRILDVRGTPHSLGGTGTIVSVSGGARVWLPGGEMAAVMRWRQGYFVREFPLASAPAARLVVELAAAPAVARFEEQRLRSLGMLAALMLLAILLATLLSRWLTRSIQHLDLLSRDLPSRIASGAATPIPGSRVAEYDSLATSIRAMADSLSSSFRTVRAMRDTLERRVAERTAELRRREAMLAESEMRFRNMADAAPALIWLSDTDNLGTWYNRRWLEYTGRSLGEELGLGWAEGVHPEDLERCVAYCNEAFAARRPFEMEFRLRRADGRYGWIADTGIPRFDASGAFEGYIGYCWDITDRKQAELALRRQQRLGEVIVRAQSEFIREEDRRAAFDGLLADILALTDSAYGFIAEIVHTPDGRPYLKTHTLTDIAWDEATRAFYAQHAATGMEFHNLDSLFGAVVSSGEPVIANDPAHDPRSGGLPAGHPPLTAFLGLPIRAGGDPVAVLGIANRHGGYDQAQIDFLRPLLVTIGQMIEALRSQRRRQEDAAQLARLSMVASQTTNGVVITDTEGRVEWINEGFTRISGYTLEELRGRTPGSVLQGADTDPQAVARIHAALQRREPFQAELVNYSKAGKAYWIHISCNPLLDAAGQLQGFMAIQSDITEQKRTEASLRLSERRFRSLVVNIPGAAYQCALDPNWTVLYISDAIEALTGYPAEDFIGNAVRSYASVIHPDDATLGNQAMHEAIAAGEPWGIEYRLCHRDGSVRWVHERGQAIRGEDGEILWLSGFIHDISERKRMERMKDEFISTVSHELRTPLTSISGALGLLAGGVTGALPEPALEMIDIAHKNSLRLTHLINDLLDMEKLVAGKLRFELQVQELMPLIEQALRDNQPYAAQYDVSFALAARCDGVRVRVDALRLQQVLANFLSNAAKFSPRGGTVEIAAAQRDGRVRVEVIDHGPGIPAAFQPYIFEKFSQADASDARQRGGTGLGLAITKELVEHMHGTVGFASAPGQGARFHFELPVW